MTIDTGKTTTTSARSNGVPPAAWVAGGVLALVTAAMAGAMVMKSTSASEAAGASQPATPVANASTTRANVAVPGRHHEASRAAVQEQRYARNEASRVTVCSSCGVVESVTAVNAKADGTGLGAVAGGVLGGVLGHQMGGGNGKTAMTVAGAIGGGLAGNEVERRTRGSTTYDVQVRMDDGTPRIIHQAQETTVGTHVRVEGDHLRPVAAGD